MRFPDDVPVLSDGRVTLRAHGPEDVEGVFEQCNDPLSQDYTPIPVPYTRDDAAAFVSSRGQAWATGESWSFAMEPHEGVGARRFAGSVGIGLQAPGIGEIGFSTHPAARGRGLTTAAVRLIVDWAFAVHGLQTIVWRTVPGNIASWRVAWHNGFTFEATTRGTLPRRGEALDGWLATLLASDSREPKTRWLRHPVLTDGHVVLRPVQHEDEARYLETVHDPDSDLWLADIPLSRDPAAFRRQGRDAELASSLGRSVQWAVADAGTDAYVGGLAMFGFDGLDHLSAEVGYRSHPDARGRGYVSAALRLALDQALRSAEEGGYGLQRVSLGAGDGNVASQAVARACGFTETGRDRRCYRLSDDRVVDLVRFDILTEEWAGASQHPRSAPASDG